jgi:uncharacterized protein DUF3617
MEFPLVCVLLLTAAPRAKELPLRAGEWEVRTTFEMSGLPMTPAPRGSGLCLDRDDARDPTRLLAAIVMPGTRCRIEAFRIDGSVLSWKADCSGRYGGKAEGTLTFSFDRAEGRLRLGVEDARGAAHEVRYRVDGKRTGSCPS